MHTYSMLDPPNDDFRRSGTVQRALTRAPLVPSQDVSRYQARDMPAPTYDLDRDEPSAFFRAILITALTIAATGGAIALVQQIGVWLGP